MECLAYSNMFHSEISDIYAILVIGFYVIYIYIYMEGQLLYLYCVN
jgi:hypothetical protein